MIPEELRHALRHCRGAHGWSSRRLSAADAAVTDAARVAAALLATRLSGGRLASPFTAREVYRNEWTDLTELRAVQGALEPRGAARPDAPSPREWLGGDAAARYRL
jgi:hypothetical protein